MDRKAIRHILANIAAIIVFSIGVISPLTPSSGLPKAIDIFVFVVVPVCVLAYCGIASKHKTAKIIFMLETVILVGIFCYLFLSLLN